MVRPGKGVPYSLDSVFGEETTNDPEQVMVVTDSSFPQRPEDTTKHTR